MGSDDFPTWFCTGIKQSDPFHTHNNNKTKYNNTIPNPNEKKKTNDQKDQDTNNKWPHNLKISLMGDLGWTRPKKTGKILINYWQFN